MTNLMLTFLAFRNKEYCEQELKRPISPRETCLLSCICIYLVAKVGLSLSIFFSSTNSLEDLPIVYGMFFFFNSLITTRRARWCSPSIHSWGSGELQL